MRLMIALVLVIFGGNTMAADRPTEKELPGYTYGDRALAMAPYTIENLAALQATLLFTDDDAAALQKSKAILAPQAEEILDTWYGFVGATPHLLYYFHDKDGAPDGDYLGRVRERFIQWVYDTADADYDQDWLNYQYEIARRHHRIGKNKTDGADGPNHIPVSYVIALVYPVTATLKPFLEKGDHSAEEVEAMHQAWIKSVLLQAILWSHPYVNEGDF